VPKRRAGFSPGVVLTVLGSGILSGMSCALDSLERRNGSSIFLFAASQPNALKKKDAGLKAGASSAEIGPRRESRETNSAR
jgi:hypothetical protein